MSESYYVSWEHEYFTDDDAAMFNTRGDAEAAAEKLRALGKRRVTVRGPGIENDDEEGS